MAGLKGKSGGARPNSGPKPKQQSDELKALLTKSCPSKERAEIIKKVAEKAKEGDVRAAVFIFDRCYGTPQSGDELRIQEAVNAEVFRFIETFRKGLSPDAWSEVCGLLRISPERGEQNTG